MCLFTHFAAGALAGGLTGNVWLGAAAGVASHAVLDAIPHYDHPDWRLELAAGVFSLLLLLLMPFATWAAVVGGIFGMVPDLENLFQKLGKMRRDQFIFPSHTGLIPHGRTLGPRTLVWQLALFVFCFGLLGLLNPGSALAAPGTDAQPVMGDPVVRLLSSDLYTTRIEVSCPVNKEPGNWSSVIFDDVQWASQPFVIQDEEGIVTALPPRLALSIAIPTRGAFTTKVMGVTWWKEPVSSVSEADLASFNSPAVFREVPLTGCNIPLGINGGILHSAIIEISHQPSGKYTRQFQAESRADVDGKSFVTRTRVPAGLLNPELFEALALGGQVLLKSEKADTPRGQYNHFDLTDNWVRLTIDENGLHSLTGQELSAMGVSAAGVDPEKIRIYRGGSVGIDADPEIAEADQVERVGLQEVAIQVIDGQDGEWNLDDEIRFYAFGTDFWADRATTAARHLDFYNHPYQNNGVYWLTWENISTSSPMGETPLRVSEINTPAGSGSTLSMAKMRLHMEKQTRAGYGLCVDDWLWDNNIYFTKTLSFDLHTPVPDSAATYVVDYRGHSHGQHSVDDYVFSADAWINDDLDHVQSSSIVSIDMQDSLRIRLVGSSLAMVEGGNELSFKSTNPAKTWAMVLDSFDIFYWANLDLASIGGQLEFAHWRELVEFDGQQVNLEMTVPSSGNVVLWDVSDVGSASVLTGDVSGTTLTCGITLDSGLDRHFLLTTENEFFRVAAGRVENPVDLRTSDTDAHYIVIYADGFEAPARNLAEFRNSFLPGISSPKAIAVAQADIFDSFSGGQKDLFAVRNYIKWVYESGGGNLQYVCLLGNATRDYRNYKNLDPAVDLTDLLSADHRNYFPLNVSRTERNSTYGSDDSYVSFDAPPSIYDTDFPDVAIGRLPAISLAEANNLVDRMIQYSTSTEPGLWSNRFLMVSDDCVSPKYSNWPKPNSSEQWHVLQAERLSNDYLPGSVDLEKVFGVSYDFPPGSGVKPQARQDINTLLSEGVTVFHYVGHGAENNLADEQMFQSQDIANLTNGMKRGAFIAFSCDVGVYDSTSRRSMAEMFLLPSSGGSIASICASQVSYIQDNNVLSQAFYGSLYPEQRVSGIQTLSESLLDAKSQMSSLYWRHNSQRYNLLSDPALSLPNPVDDLEFASTSLDTLRAGARQVAVIDDGRLMLGAGDTYSLKVEESGYEAGYIYAYWDSSTIEKPRWNTYFQKGSSVFEGHGTMNSSELRVPFKVPVQLRYGDQARLRLILNSLEGSHSANTLVSAVRQATGPTNDLVGPQINLAFENNRYRVKPGTQLTATLQDTSSIAILGTMPGNSLLLEFDDSGFMTDVTGSFIFNADSYTDGQISFPLPGDLSLGSHQAALHASDVLGNVGNDTISFVIVADSIVGMESVTLFPNPTPGPCRLIFELSDPMDIKWDIYTLSGHRIKSMEETMTAGPQLISWDGRDDQGDEIANGTYLYVLRGNVAGGADRDITETGKLVIMR